MKVVLYKNSNCDLCKMMLHELIDTPPNADVEIIHVKPVIDEDGNDITNCQVNKFPTTILFDNNNTEVCRFHGYIDSNSINKNILNYEAKLLVQIS